MCKIDFKMTFLKLLRWIQAKQVLAAVIGRPQRWSFECGARQAHQSYLETGILEKGQNNIVWDRRTLVLVNIQKIHLAR